MNQPQTSPPVRKPKLLELDLVRGLAIIAVVLIHATSRGREELATGSSSQLLFYLINIASTFAVPLFILLSGLVLFYSYDGRWNVRVAGSFLKKRTVGLVIPYLLWAFFYYGYNQIMYILSLPDMGLANLKLTMDWAVFWKMLRWAEWSYHSYFMLIIIQMYLLFPVFMTLADKTSWFRKWMIPLGLAVQGGFYVYKGWFAVLDHTDRVAPTYLGYFLVGGAMGLYYQQVKDWVDRHATLVYSLAVISGGAYVGLFVLARYKHIYPHGGLYEAAWFLYTIVLALCFSHLGRFLLNRFKMGAAVMTSIGACSFGIYLIHPSLLTGFWTLTKAPTSLPAYNLYMLATFGIIFFGSWLLVYVYAWVAGRLSARMHPGRGLKKGNGQAVQESRTQLSN